MTNTFIPHPSVRIKGTETNYLPLQCFNPMCVYKIPHMHCPFCVKTESYTDPVILKAHFRVKHVDKGIEFAGLKVLRCCDQCDIVGVIKGEKKFKGAHWHCYRCKNGFNRRDEAIKHFKTHFRNPHTTFQIQIAQDINQPVTQGYDDDEDATCTLPADSFTVNTVQDNNTSYTTSGSVSMMGRAGMDGMVNMPGVGAIETVGLSDTQTIMIIQDDNTISSLHDNSQDITSTDASGDMLSASTRTTAVGDHIRALQDRISELEEDNEDKDAQIDALTKQAAEQEARLDEYRHQVEVLSSRQDTELTFKDDKTIEELRTLLEMQHSKLIRQQIRQVQEMVTPQSRMIIIRNSNSDASLHANQISATSSMFSESAGEDLTLSIQCNTGSHLNQSDELKHCDTESGMQLKTEVSEPGSELLDHVDGVKDQNYEEILVPAFEESLEVENSAHSEEYQEPDSKKQKLTSECQNI